MTGMSDSGHLNPASCIIKTTKEKGRGVYASRFIPRNTIIESSPVLLFSQIEYESHGRHTILDNSTFKWKDGRMALSLGLGSLFNHSDHPNMSYTLEPQSDSIRFITARDIQPDEELCIFYGHNLWFSPVASQGIDNEDPTPQHNEISTSEDDGWSGLLTLEYQEVQEGIKNPYLDGDPNEVIPQKALPFTELKPPPDEEDPQSIRTIKAWVVDVPDPKHISTLLKWLKQTDLDTPDLGHLKRIRKQNDSTSFLVCNATSSADTIEPPSLQDFALPPPYIISVPASSALTPTSLALKSAIWPTMYTPRRKDEAEPWTRGKLRWAWDAMKCTVDAAIKAADEHQLPIAAHIPAPYDPLTQNSSSTSFTSSDTRNTTKNPLRHSILNIIRKIADHTTTSSNQATPQNGTNYLLNNQTVFLTHEPCIMCSMALLHSRVKEVVYLYPMPKTGGCGGCTNLPALKGVNHRFGIMQWNLDGAGFYHDNLKIEINDTVDS